MTNPMCNNNPRRTSGFYDDSLGMIGYDFFYIHTYVGLQCYESYNVLS